MRSDGDFLKNLHSARRVKEINWLDYENPSYDGNNFEEDIDGLNNKKFLTHMKIYYFLIV